MAKRLFVGNLSPNTSAEKVGHLFETIGTITTAEIMTGTDESVSLGYGYVTMDTPELAQQAISKLNGYNLDGKAIRVELAHQGTGAGAPTRGMRRGGRGRGGFPRGGRGRRPYYNYNMGGYGGYYQQPYGRGYDYGYGGYPPQQFYGNRFGRFGRGGGRGRGRGRGRRSQRRDPSAPRSTTQLHISNIPYTIKQSELSDLFKDFKVKEIILSRDAFNTNRNKGFAFIEFETPEEMDRAQKQFSSLKIQDRDCVVQPAYIRPATSESSAPEATTESQSA